MNTTVCVFGPAWGLRGVVLAAVLLLVLPQSSTAQERMSIRSQTEARALQDLLPSSPTPTVPPLEAAIDPESYVVGPSDVIGVNIWISPPVSYVLTVTPEGTLIVPTVGEIRVADLTLSQVKEKVTVEVKSRYVRGEPTVTLVAPRRVVVTVKGFVRQQGNQVLYSTDRVEAAIQLSNKVLDPGLQLNPEYDERASRRNITLRRRDGTIARVDLPKFYATRDNRWNPTLREGDEILVIRTDWARQVIGIYGGVHAPGRFEFVAGDSLLDAIDLAFGFSSLANQDSVVHSRLDSFGRKMTETVVNVRAIREGTAPNIALEPGDRLVVKERIDLREDFRVYIEGEVIYPGMYPITKNVTKLSEVLGKAGGFTEYASLSTAQLLRQSLRREDIEMERLESLRAGAGPDDSLYYLLETDLRIRKEIVNVDFEELFAGKDSTKDVILRDGDRIVVPSTKATVYVFGQVVSPGHVPFVEGRNFAYYVERAGGFTERARDGDVKVVKAKTRQWLAPDETTVERGDYIWVPKVVERPFGYYLTVAAQTAAILTAAATIALLVVQVSK